MSHDSKVFYYESGNIKDELTIDAKEENLYLHRIL